MINEKSLIVGGVIFLSVLLIFLIIISLEGGNFAGMELTNSLKTCREVQVPYEMQESYEVQEPYQAIEEYQVPLKYEVVSALEGSTASGFNYLKTLTVNLRNVDSETGLFTVRMFFKTLNDDKISKDVSGYIMSGETKSFYQTYDSDLGEDVNMEYVVVPGKKTLTKIVTKYLTVTKYKTVTKYLIEEKCT